FPPFSFLLSFPPPSLSFFPFFFLLSFPFFLPPLSLSSSSPFSSPFLLSFPPSSLPSFLFLFLLSFFFPFLSSFFPSFPSPPSSLP
ncbi:hypothetical protein ACXWRW_10585, partial [Streptococcus pyogenes]